MAMPIRWTSRAVRYLKTSAALSSPIDIMRIAQRVKLDSGFIMISHPGSQYHGDSAWIFLRHSASRVQIILVTAKLRCTEFILLLLFTKGLLILLMFGPLELGISKALDKRLNH